MSEGKKAPTMSVRTTAAEYDAAMSLAYAKHVAHFTDMLFGQPEDELRFGPGLVTDLCDCGHDRGWHLDGVGECGEPGCCGKFVAQ